MRRVWAVLALLGACTPDPPKPAGRTVADWRGKAVAVPAAPKRVVSLLPSCTELLFAAGAGAQVVGVTTYCDTPPEAASRTKIGAIDVNFEVVKGLEPDLVVAGWTMNRRSVEALEGMGMAVFCVDPSGLADVARALKTLGEVTGNREAGERAAAELERRVAAVEARVAGRPRPLVALEMTSEPRFAVPGTYTHDALEKAGARNAFAELSGPLHAAVSWEAVLARDPEVYVVAHGSEPRPRSRPGFGSMRAARSGRVHEFEARWFVYPTPRLARGVELLAEALHP